jgi:hypothetical protein
VIDRTGYPGTGRTGEGRFPAGKRVNLKNSGGLYLRRCSSMNCSSAIILNRIKEEETVSWSSGIALLLAQQWIFISKKNTLSK